MERGAAERLGAPSAGEPPINNKGRSAREALDELVAFHLLAARFKDRWPPRDAEAERLHKEALVHRLIEREFEARTRREDLGDADVRPLYDRVKDKFTHPRLIEVGVLQVPVGKRATKERRAEQRGIFEEVKAAIETRKVRTPEEMQSLSHAPRWDKKGVAFFRFVQWPPPADMKPWPRKFAEEVYAKLGKPGDRLFYEDDYGFTFATYLSELPAKNVTFEMVRNELRDGYYERWRQEKFRAFSEAAANQHRIEMIPSRLPTRPPAAAVP